MIHLNINRASNKLSKFESFLSNLSHTIKIVALSENWLKDHNQALCNLYGYRSEHRFRPLREGGGVSLLIKDDIEYFTREDLSLQSSYAESLFIEIDKRFTGKNQDAIVGVVYRPPDTDVKVFNDYLSSLLSKSKAEKKLLYILGDYNINLLNTNSHAATQDFSDIMSSN